MELIYSVYHNIQMESMSGNVITKLTVLVYC